MLAFKKPGDGIAPSRLAELVGKRAARAMPADHKLALQDVAS